MPFDFPGSPNPGDIFTDPTSGASFTWNGYAWMGGAANSLGALIVSDTPPSAPANNSLWFESDTGMLFLRYNDGNSSQWVQVNALPNGAGYMPLQGVTDGSNAPAGQIGEVIAANFSASVPLTSNVASNVGNISLTAGDWDVCGEVWFSPSSIVGWIQMGCAINSVSATLPATANFNLPRTMFNYAIPSNAHLLNLRTGRMSLTATTTIYLVAHGVFTSGTLTVNGAIIARRVR